MTVDLDQYCLRRNLGGARNIDGTGYGWRCSAGDDSISVLDACREQRGSEWIAILLTPAPGKPDDWRCIRASRGNRGARSRAANADRTTWIGLTDLSPIDKRQILELAERVAIVDTESVSLELTRMPLGCFVLRVKSRPVVAGYQRRWKEVDLERLDSGRDDRYCPAARRSERIGRWATDGHVWAYETWRIEEGRWVFDVTLDGVPYDIARRLILALKNRTFVDRREKVQTKNVLGDQLLIGGRATLRRMGNDYELMLSSTGIGQNIRLALVADRVELVSVSIWIS